MKPSITSTADGPWPQDERRGAERVEELGELNRQHRLGRRQRHQVDLGRQHDAQRALRAHEQLGQVERPVAAGELVEVVAHDAPQHFGVAALHFIGVRPGQVAYGPVAARLEAVAGARGVERLGGERAEARHGSVRQHDVLLDDVIDRLAVVHRPRPARVVAHHAAYGGAAGGGDVGREPQAVRAKLRVQLVEDDAWFDARPAFGDVHLEDRVQILRGVDDEAGSDRLTALRRAAAAHGERTAGLGADADDLDEILAGRGSTTPSGRIL
jgi:hypothetical protein